MRNKFFVALTLAGLTGCTQTQIAGVSYLLDKTPLSAVVGDRQPTQSSLEFVNRTGSNGSTTDSYVAGEVLVGLENGVDAPTNLGEMGMATVVGRLQFKHPVVRLKLSEGASIDKALAFLKTQPGVRSVSLNYRLHPMSVTPPTNDPLLPSNWAFEPKVADVYGAWTHLTGLDSKIASTTVAVIDTGTDPDHPDLNVLPGFNSDFLLEEGQPVSTASFDPKENDHGTECAGVIGAKSNNAIGAAGVVPGVAILPIKLLGGTYEGNLFSMLQGFQIAGYYNRTDSPYPNLENSAAGPVRVVSLSYGYDNVTRWAIFDDVLEFLHDRGIVVCVAAGNDNNDGRVQGAALNPGAIAVSCTMQYLEVETLAPYSSRGEEIWVAAPGNYIWSTKKGYNPYNYSYMGYSNAYGLFNGTSAATPFVAGVAALINAYYGSGGEDQSSGAWADKVRQRLADSADDLGEVGFDHLYGHGRVNARRAIELGAL